MYTKDDLKRHLREMGLTGTETIMIHSSMKSIGPVEGGADEVVDALMEFFAEGLLLAPTHTWNQMSEEYIKGEENASTPCPPGGCWDRLREENAKILLIGVTHIRNTFIHSVEEVFDVPERFTKNTTTFHIVMPDGSRKTVEMYRHFNRAAEENGQVISDNFDKMKEGYFKTNAAKKVCIGDAKSILCDAKAIFDVTEKILKKDINCFIERDEIPEEWYVEEK